MINSIPGVININSYCTKTNLIPKYKVLHNDKYQQLLYENLNLDLICSLVVNDKYQQLLYEN